jgi:Cu/Ag efflux protein CusF
MSARELNRRLTQLCQESYLPLIRSFRIQNKPTFSGVFFENQRLTSTLSTRINCAYIAIRNYNHFRYIYIVNRGLEMSTYFRVFLGVLVLCFVMSSAWAADQHSAKGVVNAIKSTAGKLTISHGPIAGLGMGAMTMDFKVYDPAMLEEVSQGHEVAFVLEKGKGGSLLIMEIEDLGKAKDAAHSESHSHQH